MTDPKKVLPPQADKARASVRIGREFPSAVLAAKDAPLATGLSPGEVPRLVGAKYVPWLLLAAGLAAAVLYFKF